MPIRVKFVDFEDFFKVEESFLWKVLTQKYEMVLSEEPDVLFFSVFGTENTKKSYDRCVRVFFTPENVVPDFNFCDYAIGFDEMSFGDRYLRLPLFYTYPSFKKLREGLTKKTPEELLSREFCSYVVSNNGSCDATRDKFYKLLNEYKEVACGGRLYNNVGGPVNDKLEFISKYKFNIAFENSSYLGYTTEKIMEPFVSNTLPIYWGNPHVVTDFNSKAFINAHDFKSLEELVEYIVKVDTNDNLYLNYFRYEGGLINDFGNHWEEHLIKFFEPISELKHRRVFYGTQPLYRTRIRQGLSYYDKVLSIKKIASNIIRR